LSLPDIVWYTWGRMELFDGPKHLFWRVFIYPVFPSLQRYIGQIPWVRQYGPPGRQRWLLGSLAPGRTAEELLDHLVSQGFKNHFIAWQDDGQVASVRKLVGYRYQYHIRIFADGEVRGHYEYTPEARPFAHLKEIDQEERRSELLEFLGYYVIPRNSPLNITPSFA